MPEHFLDGSVTQPFWDNSIQPRLEVESGDTEIGRASCRERV